MGRYSLVATKKDGTFKRIIQVKETDKTTNVSEFKEKANLDTIDSLTTKYQSEEELIKVLAEHNILSSDDYELSIEYVYNKEIKKLSVAYAVHKSLIPYISHVEDFNSKEPLDSSLNFDKIVKDFEEMMQMPGYYHFMNMHKYVSEYISHVANEIRITDSKDSKHELRLALRTYKNIRGVILGTYEYYKIGDSLNKNNQEEKFIDEVNSIHDLEGDDGLYAYYDLDDLHRLPIATRKSLKLPF